MGQRHGTVRGDGQDKDDEGASRLVVAGSEWRTMVAVVSAEQRSGCANEAALRRAQLRRKFCWCATHALASSCSCSNSRERDVVNKGRGVWCAEAPR